MTEVATLPTRVEELVDEQAFTDIAQFALDKAKALGATSCELSLRCGQSLEMKVRHQELENIEFNRGKGFSITVYQGQKKGSATSNELEKGALEQTITAALQMAEYTEQDPCAGLANAEAMATDLSDCDLYHPWDIPLETIKSQLMACEQKALSYDSRIRNSEGASVHTGQSFSLYANSHGFMGTKPSSQHSLSCVMVAKDEQGVMQRDYQYSASRNPADLWSVEAIGEQAAQRTVSRLGSKPIPTQKLPIVFRHDIAASLFAHLCSAISGGLLYRKSSFLCESQGQRLFPSFLNLHEDPHRLQGSRSSRYDGDGVATQQRFIIENGVLQNYLLSTYSANKLGLTTTGHSGGVRNLSVQAPDVSFESMISGIEKGLLVTEVMGQGIQLTTGDYSRGAAGFLIENGKLTSPVHEVTIAGNLRDMFLNIEAVANDVDKRGNTHTGSVLIGEMMVAGS